jgi:hypothetical protein
MIPPRMTGRQNIIYDRRGNLVFATGTANRGLSLEAFRCRACLEPGLPHDRLESPPPVVVTRAHGGATTLYGIVDLRTDFAPVEER